MPNNEVFPSDRLDVAYALKTGIITHRVAKTSKERSMRMWAGWGVACASHVRPDNRQDRSTPSRMYL